MAYAFSAVVAFLLAFKGQRITTSVLAGTAVALVLLWAGGALHFGGPSAVEHGSWADHRRRGRGAGALVRSRRSHHDVT